ncbi:MAG: hypothetical protein RJA20_913, partial [Bacteroidota bacterium]
MLRSNLFMLCFSFSVLFSSTGCSTIVRKAPVLFDELVISIRKALSGSTDEIVKNVPLESLEESVARAAYPVKNATGGFSDGTKKKIMEYSKESARFFLENIVESDQITDSAIELLQCNGYKYNKADMKIELDSFRNDFGRLKLAFGNKSRVVEYYLAAFMETMDCGEARLSLLPGELRDLPACAKGHKFYSLFTGQPLNKKQATLLSELTGRPITPIPSAFSKYALIEKNEQKILIRTPVDTRESREELFFSDLKKIGVSHIVFRGGADDNLFRDISKKGKWNLRTAENLLNSLGCSTPRS